MNYGLPYSDVLGPDGNGDMLYVSREVRHVQKTGGRTSPFLSSVLASSVGQSLQGLSTGTTE